MDLAGISRMSCYRMLKSEGLIQPKRIGHDLREAAEQRRQRLKAPDKFNEVLQGDFTDYVTEDGEKYRIGGVTEYLSRFNLVSRSSRHRDSIGLDRGCRRRAQRDRSSWAMSLQARSFW